MNFDNSFLEQRKGTLIFASSLLNAALDFPEMTSFSVRQLQKRVASLLITSDLDALASFIYGHNESKKAFIDMLIEWTGDNIFSSVFPKKLIDFFEDDTGHSDREVLEKVKLNIEGLRQQKFQDKSTYNEEKNKIIKQLNQTVLNDEQCKIFRDILWRISDEDGINSDYLEEYELNLKKKEGRRKKYYPNIKPFLDQLDSTKFLKREEIKEKFQIFLQQQSYDQKTFSNAKNLVIDNLHNGSFASYVYEFRCNCSHRFDGQNLHFPGITYEGNPIKEINLNLLIYSYNQILTNLEKVDSEEIKEMQERYVRSQKNISGVIPILQAWTNAMFKST